MLPSRVDERGPDSITSAAPGQPDAVLGNALDRDYVQSVNRLNQLALWPLALMVFSVMQSDASRHQQTLALLWCASIVGLHTIRWHLIRQWCRLDDSLLSTKIRWVRMLTLGNAFLLSGVVIFFADFTLAERGFATLVVVGMGGGILSMTHGRPASFWAFVVPSTAMLSLGWVMSDSLVPNRLINVNFALLLVMFCGFQFIISRRMFATYAKAMAEALQANDSQKRLKEALRAAEAASRAKTQFLASASHDLRQPLHTLSLLGGALMMQKLDPKAARIAANMNEAMQDLAAELDALLEISKLDAGLVRLHRESVPITLILDQLREIHEPAAKRKHLLIEFRRPPTPFNLCTDRQLLVRLLGHLIDNAIKYTDTGSVAVSTSLLDGVCILSVTDTGIGIAPEQQPRIFDEFYQIGNDARHRQRGLGLGLAIAQRLRRLLDADMTLESADGAGTSVSLRLKTTLSAPDKIEETPSASDGSLAMKILVVDDDAAVRDAMRLVLDGMGATVFEAACADEALRIAREAWPDLVLADLRLNGQDDGIQTVQRLRDINPRMRALLISGDTAPDRLREAADAGLALLHKPLSSAQLRAEIQRHGARLQPDYPATDSAD